MRKKGHYKEYSICDLWPGTTFPEEFKHKDIAIIKLCEPVDQSINILKVAKPTTDRKLQAKKSPRVSVSFPHSHDDGLVPRIMECQGNIQKKETSSPIPGPEKTISYGVHSCDTGAGSSGSPLIDTESFTLKSVHAGSYHLIGTDFRHPANHVNFGIGIDMDFYQNLKKMAVPYNHNHSKEK